jgi:hypothetical protein
MTAADKDPATAACHHFRAARDRGIGQMRACRFDLCGIGQKRAGHDGAGIDNKFPAKRAIKQRGKGFADRRIIKQAQHDDIGARDKRK